MAKSSSIDNIKLEVMEVQSSDIEIKLGGVMTATTDSSPIDIKIVGTPTTNNKKPKIESLWCNLPEKNWCELEKLGSRMLFVSATSTSLQLAASAKDEEEEEEEDGEGMGSFANTIYVAYGIYPHLECSSQFYKKVDNHPSCSQIYGWIDKEGLSSQISDWALASGLSLPQPVAYLQRSHWVFAAGLALLQPVAHLQDSHRVLAPGLTLWTKPSFAALKED
ncbi:hypothetical protein Q3G72_033703 [Acer saccharum]|nr:hypothetical protein Q3G72_033703 [Acer saccharum]